MYNDFEKWDASFDSGNLPELPPDDFEKIVEQHTDPIACARAMHQFMDGLSPEAQETYARRGAELIGFHFSANFLNSLVQVHVEGDLGTPHLDYVAYDMDGMQKTLRQTGQARAGGSMGYFERHYFTDEQSSVRRPAIALRLHSAAFEDENGNKVDHDNYLTIPVTNIQDYRIIDAFN